MDLKLHQLRALVAVVRHGGLRAAAQATGLTQAALAKALRQLEADTRVAVLTRDAYGVRLTPAGARLHARAQLVVAQLDRVGEDVADPPEAARGSVGVSVPPSVVAQGLAAPYGRFRERFPNVELRLLQQYPASLVPALHSGDLDFALVDKVQELSAENLHSQLLQCSPSHVVVRAGHPVLACPNVEALASLEWLKLGSEAGERVDRFRELFHLAGVASPQRVIVCDELVALHLLRNTDVAAVISEPTLAGLRCDGLVRVPDVGLPLPPAELLLVRRPDVPLTPAAQFLRDCLVAAITGRPLP